MATLISTHVRGKSIAELSMDNGYLSITFMDGTKLCLGLEGSPARYTIRADDQLYPAVGEMLLNLRLHSLVGNGTHQSVRLAMQTINRIYTLTFLRSSESEKIEPLSLRYKVTLTGSQAVEEGDL